MVRHDDEEIRDGTDVIVCRCEGVTWGTVQDAMRTFHPTSLRQLKLVTRWGMGMCQGRVCRPLMAAPDLSDTQGFKLSLPARVPLRPISMEHVGFRGGQDDD